MTVSDTDTRQTYSADGSVVTFAIPFVFDANSEIIVYTRNESVTPPTQTLKTEGDGADYTISGSNVVFNTAPASGLKVVIHRTVTFTQSIDFVANDSFPAETSESGLDRLTHIVQDLDDQLRRGLIQKATSQTLDIELPEPVANNLLAWNAAADGIDNVTAAAAGVSIVINDSSTAANEVWSAQKSDQEITPLAIQDFTTISTPGTAAQQFAGHVWGTDEAGAGSDVAYHKFATGALETDDQGSFTLTNNGTVLVADGILGGTTNGADFNGSNQYFTQTTLLDTTPTQFSVSLWIEPDDGQPAALSYLVRKHNVTNQDYFHIALTTAGKIEFETEEGNNGAKTISSATTFANGAITGFTFIVATWDTTNGMRLFINGILEAVDSTATTLMGNGTGEDYSIGATAAGASFYDGSISLHRPQNIVITQKDIDLAYATEYAVPVAVTDNEYHILARYRDTASTSFEREYNWSGVEVARVSSTNKLFRLGFTSGFGLKATDSLSLDLKRG